MKKEKTVIELAIKRPPRAVVSERDALKRMKDFSKRKEQFLATTRTGKNRKRLAPESAKLDKIQEQKLADEGLASEAAEWREY